MNQHEMGVMIEDGDIGSKPLPRSEIKHRAEFIPARDYRNRRVPGLYIRNGRFYATLWTDRGDGRKTTRRFPLYDEALQPIRALAPAKEALSALRQSNKHEQLPPPGRKPHFSEFSEEYLKLAATRSKRPRTQEKERFALQLWREHLGNARIDKIATPLLRSFMDKRLQGGRIGKRNYAPASPRTVTLDLIALRNVLKVAVDVGHLRDLPRFPTIKAPPPPRRSLLDPADFRKLLDSCLARKANGDLITKNGAQLRDFLQLLAFSGAREQEALHLRWSHVDFMQRRLFIGVDENFAAKATTIGSGGTSKNRRSRIVDFNLQLESLLREMHSRRAPDSEWIFPSPQRGAKDLRTKTLRESMRLVRTVAGLASFGFHDLRHFFASCCVMCGVDLMTIAAWLGHQDGGVLIGKVYGHLLDKHRQRAAEMVDFRGI